MPSRKEGPSMAPLGIWGKLCHRCMAATSSPNTLRPRGASSRTVAHTLNKNVCPIKCVRGALVPGAAAPVFHRKINTSPRNAQQTRGEVYGSHNTY